MSQIRLRRIDEFLISRFIDLNFKYTECSELENTVFILRSPDCFTKFFFVKFFQLSKKISVNHRILFLKKSKLLLIKIFYKSKRDI